MTSGPPDNKFLTRASLVSAAVVPVIYFTSQLAAAPFYPGYSISRDVASMLGTGNSRHPWIFNAGIMLTGVSAIFGSFGLYKSFRLTSGIGLSRTIAFCCAYTGVTAMRAGIFPLPDHRHSGPGSSFTLMLPGLMLIATWSPSRSRGLRAYLLFSTLLLLPVALLLVGKIKIAGLNAGAIQRLYALATLVPIGMMGCIFLRLEQRRFAQSPSRKLS